MRTSAGLAIPIAVLACLLAGAGCGSVGGSNPSAAALGNGQGIALASCMRSHGLSAFPDPPPGHALQFDLPAGLNPRSPAFRSAQAACRKVLTTPTRRFGGGVSASQEAAALAHALCMRSHGVPNYPDPTYLNGRPTEEPLSNYGIDPGAPASVAAAKACYAK